MPNPLNLHKTTPIRRHHSCIKRVMDEKSRQRQSDAESLGISQSKKESRCKMQNAKIVKHGGKYYKGDKDPTDKMWKYDMGVKVKRKRSVRG